MPSAQIMDQDAIRRAVLRMAHEILEKGGGLSEPTARRAGGQEAWAGLEK